MPFLAIIFFTSLGNLYSTLKSKIFFLYIFETIFPFCNFSQTSEKSAKKIGLELNERINKTSNKYKGKFIINQHQAFRTGRFNQPFTVELAYENEDEENTSAELETESSPTGDRIQDKTISNRFTGEQLSIREETDCDGGNITIRIQKRNAKKKTLKSK